MKSVKCPECGFVGWADAERCKKCGVVRVPGPTGEAYQPTEMAREYQPQYAGQYQTSYQGYSNGELKKGLAIASLVVGILNLFTLGLLGVGIVAGVVMALVAMHKAKRRPHEYGGQGLATAGLVTSVVSVVMIVPIGIVAAIAIPNLLASRRAANEGASIQALRKFHAAEVTYQSTTGNGQFGTMDQLSDDQLIDPQLATGVHYGYKFTIQTKSSGYNEPAGFEIVAVPLTYGTTGRRSFYIDETGVIRGGDNRGAVATSVDDPLNMDGYSSSSPPSRQYRREYSDY